MKINKRGLFWKYFKRKHAKVMSFCSRMINVAIGRSREITKRKWLEMKKLSSALYMLNLRKKRTIQVVISSEGCTSHRWKVRATK